MPTSPYRILHRLGSGSSGVVYAAERDGKTIAVKVLRVHNNPAHNEAILRETRIGPLIADHAGAVGVRRVQDVNGVLHLEMDLVDGPSLGQVIAGRMATGRGPLPASIVVPWFVDIFETLLWVQSRVSPQNPASFVHRDLKPANLLLRRDGKVMITDFGVAKAEAALGFQTTQTGILKGSPRFMAPEVILEKPFDARADQFSLAVCIVELLTGEPLYPGRDVAEVLLKAVAADVEPRLKSLPGPRGLQMMLRMMMQRNPHARFPTHSAARDALRGLLPIPGLKLADLLPELLGYGSSEVEHETEPEATDPGPKDTQTFLGPRQVPNTTPPGLFDRPVDAFRADDRGKALDTVVSEDPPTVASAPSGRIDANSPLDEIDAFAEPDLTTDMGDDEATPVVDVRPSDSHGRRIDDVPTELEAKAPAFENVPSSTPTAAPPRSEGPVTARLGPAPLVALQLGGAASEMPTEVLERAKIEGLLHSAADEKKKKRRALSPPEDPPSVPWKKSSTPWIVVFSVLMVMMAFGAIGVIGIVAAWFASR